MFFCYVFESQGKNATAMGISQRCEPQRHEFSAITDQQLGGAVDCHTQIVAFDDIAGWNLEPTLGQTDVRHSCWFHFE